MSKVLIDRELISVASLHLEYSGYTETGKKLRALLDTPSGTPAMPVKAYYYESPNLDGIRTRSVGLEVRKAFIDAPLVLESDALTQIACLEGEIAKRDEELAACRVAVENCEVFRARIVELESQFDGESIVCGSYRDERDAAATECERLRMQLAACGVVALANTIESAGEARQMHPDYMSASCSDVAGAVDREIALRTERDQQARRIGELEGLLRHAQKQVPTGSGLHMRIDAALSAGKDGE